MQAQMTKRQTPLQALTGRPSMDNAGGEELEIMPVVRMYKSGAVAAVFVGRHNGVADGGGAADAGFDADVDDTAGFDAGLGAAAALPEQRAVCSCLELLSSFSSVLSQLLLLHRH